MTETENRADMRTRFHHTSHAEYARNYAKQARTAALAEAAYPTDPRPVIALSATAIVEAILSLGER